MTDRYGKLQIGLSASAIHNALTYLRAIFEDAVEADLLMKSPARKIEMLVVSRNKSTRYVTT
jgi:hypothetical protein